MSQAPRGLRIAPPSIGVRTMVFIGERGVVRTPARGRFHCPHCGAARTYAYRRVRRMLVFMYLPVAGRSAEREFVECGFCHHAFPPSVLEHEPLLPGHGEGSDDKTDQRHFAELAGGAASTLLTWDNEGGDSGRS